MKKTIKVLGLVALMTLSMSIQAFAGEWKQNNTGWWYQNNDNSYPVNTWAWIDGNKDGIAECYYFNENGYMLANTNTPDNYTVNENGAWTINGVVQTKNMFISSEDADRDVKSNNQNENKDNEKMSNAEKERQMLRDMGLTDEQIDQMIQGSLGESMYGGLH